MKRYHAAAFLGCLASLALIVLVMRGPSDSNAPDVHAIDGDTISYNGDEVRLIGIDTPESVKPGVEPECGSEEAKAAMEQLLHEGPVTLTTDPTQDTVDSYGRLLRYVNAGATDVGGALVAQGLAKPYVWYASGPSEREDNYVQLADQAVSAKAGVYGECNGDFHSNQPGG